MKRYYKVIIGSLVGALAGYSYYYFIGCESGTCPITSNWHISTLYGLVIGLVAFFPTNKDKVNKNSELE